MCGVVGVRSYVVVELYMCVVVALENCGFVYLWSCELVEC